VIRGFISIAPMVVILCSGGSVVVHSQVPDRPGTETSQVSVQVRSLAERVAATEVTQRQIANDVAQILNVLKVVAQELKAVRKEVDRPLISDLWFGFVSDRFTAALNRMFGFDSGPSTPLWAAGFLSLGLLVLRTLLFFVNRFKAESTIAKVLGRTFGIIVSLYLLVLTGSLFMLATSAPGSPLESYTRQVETSDKLTNEMQAVSARVNDLLARLVNTANQIDGFTRIIGQAGSAQTGLTEKTHPTTVAAIEKIERLSSENLPTLTVLKAEVANLRTEVENIRARQQGALWTFLVGLAALVTLVAIAAFLYVKSQE
jgi:hypothetical protein